MNRQFHFLKVTRNNILQLVQDLTMPQLNKTPKGFNNNLIWNFGHVIITQQLLCYKLAGKTMNLTPDLIDKYKKGSKPQKEINEDEFNYLKTLLLSNVDQLAEDYAQGIFTAYDEYPTSYNISLNSIEDAIHFNNLHEALHLGSMMALRRNI